MVAELWDVLLRISAAASIAVLLIAILRPVTVRAFGVRIAYGLWAVVPMLLVASQLPAPTANKQVIAGAATILSKASQPIGQTVEDVTNLASKFHGLLLAIWSLGVIASLTLAFLRHRRYWQSLGIVTLESAGVVRADRAAGPALIGIFRPRLLLPVDFESRHLADERAMMLAHEEAHRRRADPLANAFGELLRCLQWFNPLVQWAHSAYRRDQEMACDAVAAGGMPDRRARYAELLVKAHKTLDSALAPPLGASWHPTHPLTARLAALRMRAPGRGLSYLGTASVGLATVATAYLGWTIRGEAAEAQSGTAPIAMHISWSVTRTAGAEASPTQVDTLSMTTDVVVASGANLKLDLNHGGTGIREFEATCTPRTLELPAGAHPKNPLKQILIACDLKNRDGESLGQPTVITLNNKEATIESSDAPFTIRDGNRGVVTYRMTFVPSTDRTRVQEAKSSQAEMSQKSASDGK